MALRETIAYNKNLLTGFEKIIKKFKDADAPMINTATVQLFDAKTGEKIYEAKAENVVNNMVAKMAYMDYFYWRIKGSVSGTNYYDPFEVIAFTNYKGAEDPTLPFIMGYIVGWADKTMAYSGTSTSQGTINLSESAFDTAGNGNLHFVFDFPTNAANGTFQTVWWGYNLYGYLPALYSVPSASNIIIVYSNGIITSGSGISGYTLPANCSFNTYNLINGSSQGSISPANMPSLYFNGAEYDGTNVWVIDASAMKLHKFSGDMTTWISSVAITGWNSSWGSITDITELNGTLYVFSQNCYIVILNKTGACGTATDIRPLNNMNLIYSNNISGITTDGVSKFFFSFSGDNTTNNGMNSSQVIRVMNTSFSYIGTIAAYNVQNVYRMLYDRVNGYLYYIANYVYKYNLSMAAPGSQNLLAAPVTKTATNTMKIQYDFQVQKAI